MSFRIESAINGSYGIFDISFVNTTKMQKWCSGWTPPPPKLTLNYVRECQIQVSKRNSRVALNRELLPKISFKIFSTPSNFFSHISQHPISRGSNISLYLYRMQNGWSSWNGGQLAIHYVKIFFFTYNVLSLSAHKEWLQLCGREHPIRKIYQ